jgi:hypothetical protein
MVDGQKEIDPADLPGGKGRGGGAAGVGHGEIDSGISRSQSGRE